MNDNQKIIFAQFHKLKKVRSNLEKLYRDEFVSNLLNQSTDRRDRYSAKTHIALKVGDLVSIRDKFSKPFDYPLGIVLKVETNDLNEVTSAHIRKANGEIVRRHVDNLIFLTESPSNKDTSDSVETIDAVDNLPIPLKRKKRVAAQKCEELNRALFNSSRVNDIKFIPYNFSETTLTILT